MSGFEITIICLLSVIAFGMLLLAAYAIGMLVVITHLSSLCRRGIRPFSNLIHLLHRAGRCVEREREVIEECEHSMGYEEGNDWTSIVADVAKWATIGTALFSKFKRRR